MTDGQQLRVFAFKGSRWYFLYLFFAITPIVVFITIGGIRQGSLSVLWFTLVLFLMFYVFGSYLAIRAASDIVIGDASISRRFAGRIIQSLSWDNVREITVARAPSKDYPSRVAINFMPKVIPRRSFTRTGRIVFATDPLRAGKLSDLINVINRQVAQHGIKVAWWVNGIKTYADHVEWPLPQMKTERSRSW